MGKLFEPAEPTYVHGWKTTDDEIWESREEAESHQNKLNFQTWCFQNICMGGHWTADMVAKEILEHWHVEHLVAPPSVTTRSSDDDHN